MKKIILGGFVVLLSAQLYSQNVAINTSGAIADASAILDVSASNMGVLVPRVALVAVTNGVTPISTPLTSLLVYNTNAAVTGGSGTGFYYWDGTQWRKLSASGVSVNDVTTATTGVSITNGVGQVVGGSNVIINVATNSATSPGLVASGAGQNTQVWGTDAAGNPGWVSPGTLLDVQNGINLNTTAPNASATTPYVELGGTLIRHTAITQGAFNMIWDETGAGIFRINHVNTTPVTTGTYPFAISRAASTEYTIGMDASFVYNQTWNSKPLLINGQGNFVAINKTTAPIQALDVWGRVNVYNGVIQRGTTQINATSDLGLYSQVVGNWIRIATNASPIKFFVDQGGGNSAGTNSLMDIDNANGGGVAISADMAGATGGTPYSRAILDLQSTSKGMLTPRMTTAQRDAMGGTLTEGLLIYNITNDCFEYWDTQATPVVGSNGFWNSLCDHCDNIVIITTNASGYNLNSALGGGKAETYCVYVQAGVTLQASAAGGAGFNVSTMPSGAKIILYNYGTILAGGGNGGLGGREVDGVCAGSDATGATGGAGGHAIFTNATVPVTVFNYGTLRAGGGGGGGGGWGCCAAGGGGGGGAGTPAGGGGGGNTTNCVSGFTCGCNSSTSTGGNAGTALVGGTGGGGANRPATGCPTCNGWGAGSGGTGGNPGIGGSAGTSGNAGGGGAAGLAIQGSGSGSSLAFNGGTVTGGVNP